MDPVEFLFNTLIEAMMLAHRAMMRANRAIEPDQVNVYLRNVGKNLLKMGAIISTVTIPAAIMLAEGVVALPTYMLVIFEVTVAIIFVTGLVAMTIGLLLVAWENPARYHRIVTVILWMSCVTAPFAMGLLLCLPFFVRSS